MNILIHLDIFHCTMSKNKNIIFQYHAYLLKKNYYSLNIDILLFIEVIMFEKVH